MSGQLPASRRLRTFSLVAGLMVCAAVICACLWDYYPPLPAHQRLTIEFQTLCPGTSEPLIVTGVPSGADFLFVRHIDDRHVAFGFDHWGAGGPTSEPLRIEPGKRHQLEIVLPALAAVAGNPYTAQSNARVSFDGTPVVETAIAPHPRRRSQLWFSENPVGGSSCGPVSHAILRDAQGNTLVGNVRDVLTRVDRLTGWLRFGVHQLIAAVLLGLATTLLIRRAARAWEMADVSRLRRAAASHRWFLLTAVPCLAAFWWVVTCGSGKVLYEDAFTLFYDYQALSLLDGRLDVPAVSLSGEAFKVDGKVYGYFGVTPALLRLPAAIFGFPPGLLTRAALLTAYAGSLVGAYLLLVHATRRRGAQAGPMLTVLFTLSVGLGSTMFFLSSRAYVYHEAIAWGVMFAVFASWFSLRQLAEPERRHWIGALVCGVLAVHARPPPGLFALSLLGMVALVLLIRHRRQPRATARFLLVGAAAVAGVLSFNAVSYLKFGSFDGCPLYRHIQYHAERLARIDGKAFHAVNIPFTFSTYFLHPSVEFDPRFPWIAYGVRQAELGRDAAKMDSTEPTTAITATMTGLVVFGVFGLTLVGRRQPERWAVLCVWLAAIPFTVALCAAVATSQRYTGDFCAFLYTAGALGAAAVTTYARPWRALALVCLTVATLWSVGVMSAMTLRYQGEMVWGVPPEGLERFQHLRTRVDGWFTPGARP
ncbi:hypothetical protein [Opitutus sp. ER46]|uniref:hypothetical protein n=1 Tax=Opitutus sp. ER46 TaxID=2161864 RepID=UPI000D2FB76B|nr:hypothetical protein [Opitutus sp. ER46]PTX92281.1 hypothetical protein DB354_13100 [Opitutus sp. ER46]